MIIRCFDSETTGIPSETESHALVELGWTDVTRTGDGWEVGYPRSTLVNPGRPIPPDASAIHHLRDEDVREAPDPGRACMMLAEGDVAAYAAHNMEFDRNFFGGGGKPMLCTFKCALRIFREAPDHSNQVLRYFIGLDDMDSFEPALAMPPHRAGPDSYVTAHIMALLLDSTNFEDLVRWSNGPALLVKCWMNKHKGKTWEQVAKDDPSYLDWIINRSDITDRNIRATAKYWMKQLQQQPTADGEIR